MKTRILINEGEYRLTKAGVMDAHIDAEELYCFLKGCDKVVLFLMKEEEADKETEEAYFKLIEKRASRIPLQHITGNGVQLQSQPGRSDSASGYRSAGNRGCEAFAR